MKKSLQNLLLLCSCFFVFIANSIAQQTDHFCSIMGCTAPAYYEGVCTYNLNPYRYRTIDGAINNIYNTDYGQSHISFERLVSADYADDGSSLIDRANPRLISNTLCAQSTSIPSARNLSTYMFTWLQFLDHDITLTEEAEGEFLPIPVPAGDTFFDPFNTGTQFIPFTRVAFKENTGTSSSNPREQINELTAWIDGSSVYGADQYRGDWLRTNHRGKLKTSSSANGDILPCNTITGDCNDAIDETAPFMSGQYDNCGNYVKVFVAGDVRANEQPSLTALHTLFVREHNRICDLLISNGYTNDEYNYQFAKRIVSGIIQSITYNEVLPALGIHLDNYRGYKRNKSPNIFNEFATAAYRLGHTMVNSDIAFLNENCEAANLQSGCGTGTSGIFGGVQCVDACGSEELEGPVALRNAFFNPSLIGNNGFETMLLGLASETQQEVDLKVVDDIRNFLFGAPGSGGLDLASINIQRGRDHGLGDYNSIREALGLGRLTDFNQITSNIEIADNIENLYGSIDDIDAWIGMLAEDHLPDSEVGPTLYAMIKLQFENIRDADRFWFERDSYISSHNKQAIKSTRLADVIKRNTNIESISDVFYTADCQDSPIVDYCPSQGGNTHYEWIKKVRIGDFRNESGNDNGYGDYTQMSTDMMMGVPTYVKLIPGYSSYQYYQRWVIWIDYNQDGNFTDDECVYARYGRTKSAYITIPHSATEGPTRMRIAMSGTNNPSACGAFQYGEVEDYSINILPFNGSYRIEYDTENEDEFLLEESHEGLTIFPNPAASGTSISVFYNSKNDKIFPLQVFNSVGQLVYQKETKIRKGENTIEIPLTNMQVGAYTILYNNGHRMVGERFIVVDQ